MFSLSFHPHNLHPHPHTSAQTIHMEEEIPIASKKQIHDPQVHNISDVQKNVNLIMEHLNDPNFNLSHSPSFTSAIEEQTRRYGQDGNEAISFDKSDLFYPLSYFTFSKNIP